MKKLLSLLGAIGLTATTGATVVACGQKTTKKDVSNDVVTKQSYQVATQNIMSDTLYADEGTDPEEILIQKFENHLRGYLNPLFLNLIGQNNVNINDDYEIQGVTAQNIKDALEEIKKGSEEASLSGITVVAKDNAQYLSGEVVLPTISILEGVDLLPLVGEVAKILVECEDYLPTFEELLKKLNEAIANSTGELEKLKMGNFTFEIDRGKIIVTGNGLYYGSFILDKFNSKKAIDISTVITPDKANLGKMGFIKVPTTDQLFAILSEKFGEEYNANNMVILNRNNKQTKLLGHNHLKGETVVEYSQDTFDLSSITNKSLGAIESAPKSKTELVEKINAVNDGLSLTEDLITIAGKINDTNVYISAKEESDVVQGIAEIKWSIKQFELNEVVKVTDLGALAMNASDTTILEAVNKLNDTDLVLDKDVKIDGIQDTENGGRTAVLTAIENHPKYKGSVRVNWIKIAELTGRNVEKAIKDLKDQERLVFKIKAGTKVDAAKSEVTDQIKKMLAEKYAIPSAFAVKYSEFPDEAFLAKPTSPNNPWMATEKAQMIFTLNSKEEPVTVTINWRIDVI